MVSETQSGCASVCAAKRRADDRSRARHTTGSPGVGERTIEGQIREQKALDMLIAQAKITAEEAPSLIVTPEQAKREEADKSKSAKAKKEPK